MREKWEREWLNLGQNTNSKLEVVEILSFLTQLDYYKQNTKYSLLSPEEFNKISPNKILPNN